MNKTAQILLTAADLIEHVGWTRGVFARSKFNRPICPKAQGAACWCAIGAILSLCDTNTGFRVIDILEKKAGNNFNVPYWNDGPAQAAENVANTMRECALEILGEA
jgi:hypothetical protein